jgi:hypothetical protein
MTAMDPLEREVARKTSIDPIQRLAFTSEASGDYEVCLELGPPDADTSDTGANAGSGSDARPPTTVVRTAPAAIERIANNRDSRDRSARGSPLRQSRRQPQATLVPASEVVVMAAQALGQRYWTLSRRSSS